MVELQDLSGQKMKLTLKQFTFSYKKMYTNTSTSKTATQSFHDNKGELTHFVKRNSEGLKVLEEWYTPTTRHVKRWYATTGELRQEGCYVESSSKKSKSKNKTIKDGLWQSWDRDGHLTETVYERGIAKSIRSQAPPYTRQIMEAVLRSK